MLTIGEWTSRYDGFYNLIREMARAQWEEVGSHREILQLNPDHEHYRALQRAGLLHMLIARDDRKPVGYMIFHKLPRHPRDIDASVGSDDTMYVLPAYRQQRVGVKLIKRAIEIITADGANIMFLRQRVWQRKHSDALMRYLGFAPHEVVWAKIVNPIVRRAADIHAA